MEQDKTAPNEQFITSSQTNAFLDQIYTPAITVILQPERFYSSDMSKTGGYAKPLIFMMVLAAMTALVMILTSLIGLGSIGMMAMGMTGIVILPVMVAIFGFIGAAIAFVIWKLMGSNENFETAYRCVAYSYAYAPVAALFMGIPFIGALVSSLWPMALLAIASIHVHSCSKNVSWGVFGALGLLMLLMSI